MKNTDWRRLRIGCKDIMEAKIRPTCQVVGISLCQLGNKILSNILLSKHYMQRKLLGVINLDFEATGQLLVI